MSEEAKDGLDAEALQELEDGLKANYGTKNAEVDTEVDTKVEEVKTDEVVEEVDDDLLKAQSNGWNPDKGSLTAKEFNMRGEFIGQMREYQDQIKNLHQTVTKMTQDQQQRDDQVKQQTIADMETKRREAVESGDVDTFDAYDKQLKAYDETKTEEVAKSVEVKDFLDRNSSWYNNDTVENYEMSQFSFTVDNLLNSQNPNISDGESLRAVEAEIRKRFPARFTNTKKTEVATVGGSTKTSKSKSVLGMPIEDLNSRQKMFYEMAVKGDIPGMTGKDYLKSLKQIEETGKIG